MINRGSAREGTLVGRVRAFFSRTLKYSVDEPSKVEEPRWDAEDYLKSRAVDPPIVDPWEVDAPDDTEADDELSLGRPSGDRQEDETERINPEPDLAGTAGEPIALNGSARDVASRRDGGGSNIADETRAGTGIDADDVGDAEFDEIIEVVDVVLQAEEAFLVEDIADKSFVYDPDAHQTPWAQPEPGDEKSLRRARAKAAAVTSMIEVTRRLEQEELLDFLTQLFFERGHSATFRAIQRIAAEGATSDLLRAVIALRDYWMERREWWVGRYGWSREVRSLHWGSGGLGWAAAARVCRSRLDYVPEDMIDESWFDEWLNLPPGTPGYLLFAAYVDAKVTDPASEQLHDGLMRVPEFEDTEELGDERGWWRSLPRYDEDIRFGFNVLTPFRDGFGPPGYPETQDPFRGGQSDT